MKLFASSIYGANPLKWVHTLGYVTAENKDEAMGKAIADFQKENSDKPIISSQVIEIQREELVVFIKATETAPV